ncbi:MAG: hypothetical protein GY702_00180, partial [Desulfobulbaceae bacterium]|nr:hypothetical protein [Desulfobulbaceae bacterium]
MVATSPRAVGAGRKGRSGVANDVVVGNPGQTQNVDNVNVVSDVVANNNDKRIVIFKNNKKSKKYNVVSSQTVSKNVYDVEYEINPSPLNVDRFVPWLHDYDESLRVELTDMLNFGVHIPSSKVFDPLAPVPPNQKSTDLYYDQVDTMICTELLAKRIAGPFLTPPPGLIISPLGAVPKKQTDKIRIIHN